MAYVFRLAASLPQANSTTLAVGEVQSQGASQYRCLTLTALHFTPRSGSLSIGESTYFLGSSQISKRDWGAIK